MLEGTDARCYLASIPAASATAPADAVVSIRQPTLSEKRRNIDIDWQAHHTARKAPYHQSRKHDLTRKGISLLRRGNRRIGVGDHFIDTRRCRAASTAVPRARATHLFFATHTFFHHQTNRQTHTDNQNRQHNGCRHIHNHSGLVSIGRTCAPCFHSPGTLPLLAAQLLLIE